MNGWLASALRRERLAVLFALLFKNEAVAYEPTPAGAPARNQS